MNTNQILYQYKYLKVSEVPMSVIEYAASLRRENITWENIIKELNNRSLEVHSRVLAPAVLKVYPELRVNKPFQKKKKRKVRNDKGKKRGPRAKVIAKSEDSINNVINALEDAGANASYIIKVLKDLKL